MKHTGAVPHLAPWRALAIFLAVGALWFGLGDALVPYLIPDHDWYPYVELVQDYAFVLGAGIYAAWLLYGMMQTERHRQQTHEELSLILRHAPVGIAHVQVHGSGRDRPILWANDRFAQLLGRALPEVLQQDFRTMVAPANVQWVQSQLQRLLTGEIDHYQDIRQITQPHSGQVLTVSCTVTAVHAAQQQVPMLVCVVHDISEIEAARAVLATREQQLRLALDGSGSGMWDWDMVQRKHTFSQGMARLMRYEGTDLNTDLRFKERLHPEDKAMVGLAARHAVATGEPFEVTARVQCFDGEYRWFESRGMRHLDASGKVLRFSGIITDKTQQRAEEARLRLAATVVDNAAEGIVVTDAHSQILWVNPAFSDMLGYTEQELLGKRPSVFKSGRHDAAFYSAMWADLQQRGQWRGKIWNKRKNGEMFPERMSLSAVKNEQGVTTHYVCMFTDISQEEARKEQLQFLAHHDPLTGLFNRTWLTQELQTLVQEASAQGEQMAVILLNLDRFKDVNDSYGHAVGDQVLRHIAREVQQALRPGDVIGRLAGDEIVVIARHLAHPEDAAEIAERLIHAAAQPWKSPDGFAVVVSVSAGICSFPQHAQTASALIQGAHAAVYAAKQGQGDSSLWCFFHESMTQAARERIALEARLRDAVAQGHLQLFYQPQIDIASGRLVGAEALLRWFDPVEGMISPARFIPVAETSGLIGPLGEWVIAEVCRQMRSWQDAGLPPISVAVNVSLHQFLLTDVVGITRHALSKTGLEPQYLELEITESALAQRPDEALLVLRQLKQLGLRLAIDDFGTGYSSLAHLKRFPIDLLKIDQGFIRDIPHSADDMAISHAVIAMGQSMGMQVLAEGVETAEQLEFLRQHGCNFYQGYLCSKPLPAAQFTALLQEEQTRRDVDCKTLEI